VQVHQLETQPEKRVKALLGPGAGDPFEIGMWPEHKKKDIIAD
jgi:hypothetical protein